MMNIARPFKATCVVDWSDIEFRYRKASPAWRVHRLARGAFSRVTGLDLASRQDIRKVAAQGANTPTTCFVARIQNPERHTTIVEALDAIRSRIDPAAEVLVTGIEVSFDVYLPGADKSALAELTASLVSSINHVSNALPRLYRLAGETHFPCTRRELVASLTQGYTVGYGHRDDDLYTRAYVKTTDDSRHLPVHEQRARIEVRLQGDSCPVRTIHDLREFNFAELSRFFRFRQQSAEAPSLYTSMQNWKSSNGGILDKNGQLVPGHRYRGRRRKTAPFTRASPLNEIVRDQLRKLTDRWQAQTGRGRARRSRSFGAYHAENPGGLPGFAGSRVYPSNPHGPA